MSKFDYTEFLVENEDRGGFQKIKRKKGPAPTPKGKKKKNHRRSREKEDLY